MTEAPALTADERRDALVGKLFMGGIEALDLLSVYLGDKLGLYRALADRGPLTSGELSEAAGIHERYAREWLEQQAASGILDLAEDSDDPSARRLRLPEGHDEALLDRDSLNYIAPLGQMLVALARPIHEVMQAYRDGGGLPLRGVRRGRSTRARPAFTRPLYLNLLGQEWLPAATAINERLLADPPARVADVACGGRHLQHRDRACLPEGARRRHRLRPTLDRAREAPPRRESGRRRARRVPLRRCRRPRSCRPLRPRHDLRGPARHVVSGQGAGGRPGAARGGWIGARRATSGRPIASRHPQASSSGSSTGPASSTACSSAWSARGRRAPAPSCGSRPSSAMRRRRASEASRCSRSSTTSTGSTASRRRAGHIRPVQGVDARRRPLERQAAALATTASPRARSHADACGRRVRGWPVAHVELAAGPSGTRDDVELGGHSGPDADAQVAASRHERQVAAGGLRDDDASAPGAQLARRSARRRARSPLARW